MWQATAPPGGDTGDVVVAKLTENNGYVHSKGGLEPTDTSDTSDTSDYEMEQIL